MAWITKRDQKFNGETLSYPKAHKKLEELRKDGYGIEQRGDGVRVRGKNGEVIGHVRPADPSKEDPTVIEIRGTRRVK